MKLIQITLHILVAYKRSKANFFKTGLTIDNNMSNHMIKTLKIIYSGQKGARLYYEMLIQDAKPKCCEKWETKLNTDIN